jgi:hypothetical protein
MRPYPIPAICVFSPIFILLASCVTAQPVVVQPAPVSVDVYGQPPAPPPDDATALPPLDQLMAPIALYPDPLVSLILPASTYPDQVQQAASFLQGGGTPDQAGGMGWDPSVQGLAHYPSVIEWMAANYDWTVQLGGAFANQPADVMDAVQDLRRRAQAAGTLVNTPQQQVVVDQNMVEILPAQPQMIYVPQYDPAVVYVEQPPGFDAPLFAWGQPYPVGVWLTFDFDWQGHAVWQGDWYDYRMQHGGWSRPVDFAQFHGNVRINNSSYSGWHAPRNAPPAPPQLTQRRGASAGAQAKFAQPHVMSGAPKPPANAARVNSLVVSRGERPAPAKAPTANTSPQESRPRPPQQAMEPAGPRPSGSASGEVAAQPRLQPQNPSEGERKPTPTQEQRKEQVLAEPKAPPATVRSVEPESERSVQSRPASEPVREVAPAKGTPEVTKKPTPNSKEEEEKAQKAKEQKEKETQPEVTPPK